MPEIGTSGSMSGDGKRSVAEWPKLPRPSSTLPSRTSRREPVSQAVTLARGGRQARFSDKSHLDRIREERVTPLVQGPHEVRLGVDCSTFAIAPFSSVGIELERLA